VRDLVRLKSRPSRLFDRLKGGSRGLPVSFLFRYIDRSQVKIKVKGSGQECPLHTGRVKGKRAIARFHTFVLWKTSRNNWRDDLDSG
jgi:hypothetical protein